MAESVSHATETTPRDVAAVGDGVDGTSSTSTRGNKGGQSRAKAAQQRERLGVLCKPVVRRHVIKDLTKVPPAH